MNMSHPLVADRLPALLWRAHVATLLVATVVMATPGAPVLAQRAPSPAPTGLSPEVLSLACAPGLAYEVTGAPLRVTGSQESAVHYTFAPGDLIVINGGTDNGIEVGQEYFTRRAVPVKRGSVGRDNPATIHPSGWIRVYAVDDELSLVTVAFGCDQVQPDDYLEPFVLPDVPEASTHRPTAQCDNYCRILTGADNRTNFGSGDYFVVDRGSNHGVTAGASSLYTATSCSPISSWLSLAKRSRWRLDPGSPRCGRPSPATRSGLAITSRSESSAYYPASWLSSQARCHRLRPACAATAGAERSSRPLMPRP